MWKSPDNLWSIYCLLDAECNCPALQQSGPSCYRSFSSDLLTAKRNASLKLMQYFLSYLSLSYEFVLGSRNKSKWCTITATATLHGLLEIVTTVTSFHRNDGGILISMMMIRVILVTSGQWSGWHWLGSFVSFMTSSSLQWWRWNVEMCDRYDEPMRDASRI